MFSLKILLSTLRQNCLEQILVCCILINLICRIHRYIKGPQSKLMKIITNCRVLLLVITSLKLLVRFASKCQIGPNLVQQIALSVLQQVDSNFQLFLQCKEKGNDTKFPPTILKSLGPVLLALAAYEITQTEWQFSAMLLREKKVHQSSYSRATSIESRFLNKDSYSADYLLQYTKYHWNEAGLEGQANRIGFGFYQTC